MNDADRLFDAWMGIVSAPMEFPRGRGFSVATRGLFLIAYLLWFVATLPITAIVLFIWIPMTAIEEMK